MRHPSPRALAGLLALLAVALLLPLPPRAAETRPVEPNTVPVSSSNVIANPSLFVPMANIGVSVAHNPIAGVWYKDVINDIYVQRAMESGARWARMFLTWAEVEPIRTTPPTFTWGDKDSQILLLRQAGIEPMVNILDAPDWAAFPVCGPFRDTDALARWTQFVQAAVQRYSQAPYNVRYWQLYNEPDFIIQNPSDRFGGGFGGGCWGQNPRAYGEMLRATTPAIKAIDPNARVVFGAVATPGCANAGSFNCTFVQDVINPAIGNAGAAFDLLGFNQYRENRRAWEQFGMGMLGKAEGLRRAMAQFGVTNKGLVVSEVGIVWGPAAPVPLTELDLANRVAQELTLSFVDQQQAAARGIQSVIWFTLRNQAQADDWHGLTLLAGQQPAVNAPPATEGQITLGYTAYQRWVQELTGTRLLRNESQPTWNTGAIPVPEGARPCYPVGDPRALQVPSFCDTLQRYVFTTPRGIGERWVVWIDAGTFVNAVPSKTSATRTLVLPRQPVAVRDVLGAPVPVTPNAAGQPTVVVSESPIYITFG